MIALILGLGFGSFLAYANGANDNFKGVATLFGSGTSGYRAALIWATVTTALGSIAAIFIANGLLEAFEGKGIVPAEVAAMTGFGLSVALAAAMTVMLATKLGFPISTTHALIGALVGAGWFASDSGIAFERLGAKFFLPLLASPVLAMGGAILLYPVFRAARRLSGIERETCVCVGTRIIHVLPESAGSTGTTASALRGMSAPELPGVAIGTEIECRQRYAGSLAGVSAEGLVNKAHYLSSGIVSFARGLNDAPKIAALLLAGGAFSPAFAIAAVAALMAAGGWISARKVAEKMALRVTEMNHGQGFTANLVTGILVIAASKFGMPVSTTHVSCGSLFGIGTVTRQARWRTIATILAAWVITLPAAAVLAALAFQVLRRVP